MLPRFTTTPYTLLLVATATGMSVLTLGVLRSSSRLRSRSRRSALLLAGMLAVTAVWCVSYALQLSSPDAAAAGFWNDVRLLGPTLVSPLVLLFAAEYTGREAWFRGHRIVAVFSMTAVTNVLAWTNAAHGLVRRDIAVPPGGDLFTEVAPGPWAPVYATFNYLLMAAAVYMLVVALRERARSRLYRGQVGTLLVALLVPTAANLLYFLGVTRVDGTPVAFAVAGVTFAVSLYRYRLLDIVPIARSTVFENVELGALVVDANEYARRLVDQEALVGTTLPELLPADSAAVDRLADLQKGSDRIEIETDGRSCWFDVDVTTIQDATGRRVGRVLMFNDVTESVRRQRELRERTERLEQKNERLDQFASIVSHDLRNPLTVAQGHLDLAYEDPDPETLSEIEVSLDRMEEMVDEVLALARQSRDPVDPQQVDLAAVAAEAWDHVDTGEATLHIDTTRAVTGDPTRLVQAFENLFRNTLDHGPDDVTVRVGDLDGETASDSGGDDRSGGFFVEDDGPGIPAGAREKVFDRGFTTTTDGTGFGLAIVRRTVEAHGWSIGVTEGTDGGARFEILTG